MVHGLAGSGALTALVLASLQSTAARLAYIVFFGLGSVAGMALLSGLAGWPLARIGPRMAHVLSVVTGIVSVGLGVLWGLPLLTGSSPSPGCSEQTGRSGGNYVSQSRWGLQSPDCTML